MNPMAQDKRLEDISCSYIQVSLNFYYELEFSERMHQKQDVISRRSLNR